MPFSFDGIEVFFYTLAATGALLSVLYVVRRHRSHFHYQETAHHDEEEAAFGSELVKRNSQSGRSQQHTERKQRDELFDDEPDRTAGSVEDIEFDRDELDQLRMLSQVRAANERAVGKSAAALIDESDESDEDEDRKEVIIDMPPMRPPAASQPTQPLPSPHRLQQRQSASTQQQAEKAGKEDAFEERKEPEASSSSRADRHERAVI